jgi:putative salt-induced outer membrane protein
LCATAAFGQGTSTTNAPAHAVTNAPPKVAPWDVAGSLGLTITRGNSRTELATASLTAARKWDHNELSLGTTGIYGENDGTKNSESLAGFGQYNRLFNERWFGYGRLDMLHDAIAGVDYRLSVGPGAGYYFIKNTNMLLRAEGGAGYIYEEDANNRERSYISLRAADRFEYKISAAAKIWQSAEYLPQVDNFNNYILNFEVGIESAMTKKWSLISYVQDTYHNEPVPGRLKNDLKWITGVKFKF